MGFPHASLHRLLRHSRRFHSTLSTPSAGSRLSNLRNQLEKEENDSSSTLRGSSDASKQALNTHHYEGIEDLIPTVRYAIKTYGCQMNVSDTQLIRSLLNNYGEIGGEVGGGEIGGGEIGGGEIGGGEIKRRNNDNANNNDNENRKNSNNNHSNNNDSNNNNSNNNDSGNTPAPPRMNSVYFKEVTSESDADVVLTNTCAIREGAEDKVWQRLRTLRSEDDKSNLGVPKGSRNDRIIGVLGCMAERLKKDILEDEKTDVDLVVGPDAYRELPGILEEHWMTKGGGGA